MENNLRHCVVFNANQETKRRTSGAYRFANQIEGLGWRVTVVDWVPDWPEHKLWQYLDAVVGTDTVMFAFSYTWMKHWWVEEGVRKLKKRYPGRKYLAGGQQFFQYDMGFDVMCYGYAEKAIPEVLAWLFDGGPKPKGKDMLGGLLIDCNSDYTAMNLGDYGIDYRDDDFIQPHEMLTVELSRGCKFQCKYCNYAFLGVKEDTSTAGQLLYDELIDNYERFGVTNYILVDDTLNDRESKLEMLGDVVQSLPFEPNFACFIRMDLTVAKPQQLKLLSRARVWAHFYGVETFCDAAGKEVAKGMPSKRIKQGLLDMREHMMGELGLYRGSCGMIAGLPHETPDSWQRSEDWLEENWGDQQWDWWPLEISTDTSTATTSIFSKEWKKHGYRQIQDPTKIKRVQDIYTRSADGVQHKFDDSSLYWEADWADIEQATNFVQNWRLGYAYHKALIGSFNIIHWKPFIQDNTELLKFRTPEGGTYNDEIWQNVLGPYIDAKLKSVEPVTEIAKKAGPHFINIRRNEYFETFCNQRRRRSDFFFKHKCSS